MSSELQLERRPPAKVSRSTLLQPLVTSAAPTGSTPSHRTLLRTLDLPLPAQRPTDIVPTQQARKLASQEPRGLAATEVPLQTERLMSSVEAKRPVVTENRAKWAIWRVSPEIEEQKEPTSGPTGTEFVSVRRQNQVEYRDSPVLLQHWTLAEPVPCAQMHVVLACTDTQVLDVSLNWITKVRFRTLPTQRIGIYDLRQGVDVKNTDNCRSILRIEAYLDQLATGVPVVRSLVVYLVQESKMDPLSISLWHEHWSTAVPALLPYSADDSSAFEPEGGEETETSGERLEPSDPDTAEKEVQLKRFQHLLLLHDQRMMRALQPSFRDMQRSVRGLQWNADRMGRLSTLTF